MREIIAAESYDVLVVKIPGHGILHCDERAQEQRGIKTLASDSIVLNRHYLDDEFPERYGQRI
ncbi:MAG: hypothetical protein V3V98_06685 [Thermoplasmata archaeon]